ncbi:hypothetical protein FPE01S_03_01380 [Flavihumibacter petaseus NBRC 106054]|uniref:Uncharacterized protein n=1 Tax=Flavihumibacter petaseus NBRC 106054 TaxID=1220578 RepID=A0A0E9N2M7_9BACT|nr:hypothetical protein FPE01S_03_01380 [Flavihumibacter petaseus NBRC 106054]
MVPVLDTIWSNNTICKAPSPIHFKTGDKVVQVAQRQTTPGKPLPISIHGNVQYDFLYRSFIDTPYSQKDYQQHTVRTNLTITVRDQYPIRLNTALRLSNSPWFTNFFDVGAQFDQSTYLNHAKQALLEKASRKLMALPDLDQLQQQIRDQADKINALKKKFKSPDPNQQVIKDREMELFRLDKGSAETQLADLSLPSGLDGFDRIVLNKGKAALTDNEKLQQIQREANRRQQTIDSLEAAVRQLQGKYDSLQHSVGSRLSKLRQQVNKAKSLQELNQIGESNELPDESTGFKKFLTNIKSIGVGRTMINYSELTAWNVALTGGHIEYNKNIYAAVAVGKIDYGFRDFFNKNTRQNGQQLAMVRFGVGDIDRKALIFSVFSGRKYSYGSVVSDSVNNYVNVMGYALEAILKKDNNTGASVEVAKTTIPMSGSFKENNGLNSLVNFSDQSNLAISLKGQTVIQPTDTRLSGFFRKSGEHFQSFSLFSYNTDQTAWMIKADQSLFKNRIGIVASLRRNDFTNPFTEKTFKTSTVFKSFQVTIRVPKYPVLSVGYYPGSQLYIIDKDRIRENAYYVMNASLMHQYKAGSVRMLSSLLYNRYASKGTDTGFIAYSGTNYMAAQSVILPKLQLQGLYMFTDQEQMQYNTMELSGDWTVLQTIRVGAGAKYNKILEGAGYWGGRGQLTLTLKAIGMLQFQYDKSYLPTIYQTLFPVEMGRVTWTKFF